MTIKLHSVNTTRLKEVTGRSSYHEIFITQHGLSYKGKHYSKEFLTTGENDWGECYRSYSITTERPIQGNNHVFVYYNGSDLLVRYNITETGLLEIDYREPEIHTCNCCGRNHTGQQYLSSNRHNYDEERYVCSRCHNEETHNSIRSYWYKPEPVFHGEGDFHIGVELEMVNHDCGEIDEDDELSDIAMEVTENGSGFVYCKRDGSLNEIGFETVTHPFTLEYERETNALGSTLKTLVDHGMVGGKECEETLAGVHIHMSRTGVTHGMMYKMLEFIGSNSGFVQKIARRASGYYNQYGDLSRECDREYIAFSGGSLGHHAAVSFTSQTIEFRIFNSTIHYKYLMSYIEFVYALRGFSKKFGITMMSGDWFRRYVKQENYPYLQSVIEEI